MFHVFFLDLSRTPCFLKQQQIERKLESFGESMVASIFADFAKCSTLIKTVAKTEFVLVL